MRLLIVRHADPDYENDRITPHGRLEASALAERLRDAGLDRLYSSPLGRARETAEFTSRATGKAIRIEPWTAELEGLRVDDTPWGSLAAWDLPGEVLRSDELTAAGGAFNASPLLSSVPADEVRSRVARDSDVFLESLGYFREGSRYRVLRPNRERVAVFCHGGFGLTWLSHLLQIPTRLAWAGFWLHPASVTTILFDVRNDGYAAPRCLAVGDTGHLLKAGLSENPRGIIENFD